MTGLRRQLAAGLALGILVLVAIALLGDVRQVRAHILGFAWGRTPLILTGVLANYALRFARWHFYLGRIDARGLSMRESARVFVAGFPLAVTPGKVGEALKGVWLHQVAGAPIPKGMTVVLAERVSDGLAVLGLSTLGVIAYPKYWPGFLAVLGLLLAAVVLSQVRPLALWALGIAERLPLVGDLAHHLHDFYEGTYALFRPAATLVAVGLGLLAWLGEGIALYLVLVGLGVPGGIETLSLAVFVFSFSKVVGAVSVLPGGLIATEASIAGMLTLLAGLQTDTAAAATLIVRFFTLWFGVGVGLLVWAFSGDLLLMRSRGDTPAGPGGEEAAQR